MSDVTVVIPNYNGISYLDTCLRALAGQEGPEMEIIVVDNGSSDGSPDFIRKQFPEVGLVCLDQNYGFCRAVNEGIQRAQSPFVILLNNDTEVLPGFTAALFSAIQKDDSRFSCAARMLTWQEQDILDNAGDFYCALGWGIARGKGEKASSYAKEDRIFSSCAGAAIYRRDLLLELGGFDEAHFAYLEDMDLSYRARLRGYENWYEPEAQVLHMGSATSGSRYNRFKVLHSAGNNVYLIYKNMPLGQIILNSPFLLIGFLIKYLFFCKKGLGKDYREGLQRGIKLCKTHSKRKIPFRPEYFRHYVRIQLELWKNILLFLPGRK